MSVNELIEELRKLPPQAALQPVHVKVYGEGELTRVSWEGNHITLEGE